MFSPRPFRGGAVVVLMATVSLLSTSCVVFSALVPEASASADVALKANTAAFVGDGLQHGPAGSAVRDVVRDGGQTAIMPDGYTLQVNSDTVSVPEVKPGWFMTNSANLSPPGDARTTLEMVAGNRPKPVLPMIPGETLQTGLYDATWPSGVTWVPDGVPGGGRALITYHRYRVDTRQGSYSLKGVGVAEYRYPGAWTAVAQGIEATRLNDDLFPDDNPEEMGSPVYKDGWVYLYGCNHVTVACFGARVTPDRIADPRAWKWWDGGAYNAARAQRRPTGVGEFTLPNVQWVPAYGAYVLAAGRAGSTMSVRWASNPAGPWTDPQIIALPDCGPRIVEGGCYLPVVRPESTTTSMIVTFAKHGTSRLRVASLPVSVPGLPAPPESAAPQGPTLPAGTATTTTGTVPPSPGNPPCPAAGPA